MTQDKMNAIYASAYNVCGPRAGNAATPATVRDMVSADELRPLVSAYACHVASDRFALYTAAEVNAAGGAL